MIKVSCPSCNASYDVDEHRLPDDGLRMRCPKCSESFQVHRDGSTAKSGGGAAPGATKRSQANRHRSASGPQVPPPAPAAAIKSPPSICQLRRRRSIYRRHSVVGISQTFLHQRQAAVLSISIRFADPGLADLPAPKGDASPSGFDPFADMDLPALREAAGGTDLPAPLRRSDESRSADGPHRRRSTDAALESTVPAPISLDSELPMSERSEGSADRPRRLHGPRHRRSRAGSWRRTHRAGSPGRRGPRTRARRASAAARTAAAHRPARGATWARCRRTDVPRFGRARAARVRRARALRASRGGEDGVHRMPHLGGAGPEFEAAPQARERSSRSNGHPG